MLLSLFLGYRHQPTITDHALLLYHRVLALTRLICLLSLPSQPAP